MRFLVFLFLLSSSVAHAQVFRNAGVEIDGVHHNLITAGYLEYGRYREAPESMTGFCARHRLKPPTASVTTRLSKGPYALLNLQGEVAKTFEDSPENRGRFFVAETLECG